MEKFRQRSIIDEPSLSQLIIESVLWWWWWWWWGVGGGEYNLQYPVLCLPEKKAGKGNLLVHRNNGKKRIFLCSLHTKMFRNWSLILHSLSLAKLIFCQNWFYLLVNIIPIRIWSYNFFLWPIPLKKDLYPQEKLSKTCITIIKLSQNYRSFKFKLLPKTECTLMKRKENNL